MAKKRKSGTVHIALPCGGEALVDQENAYLARQYNWHRSGANGSYVATNIDGHTVYLHRLVLGAASKDLVKHIDGDHFNCQHSNLTLIERFQRKAGMSETKNKNRYRGIVWHPKRKKFQARVKKDQKYFRGPYRPTAEEAARDWDAMARGIFGPYTTFNFPRPSERGVTAVVTAPSRGS